MVGIWPFDHPAMDPLFCTAYALDFINKNDPAVMTFRNQENHPVAFMGEGLIIWQLLVWDCPECKYERTTHNRHLLIPRGMQFGKELFPQIVIPRNHAAPYHDPNTGKEAPFVTVGPFSSTDTLFPGITRDLELYTTEEVMCLRSTGAVKSSSGASLSLSKLSSLASLAQIQSAPTTPKVIPGSPKVEPDLSSKKWDYTSSSKSHKCLVSVAAGSSASLERSSEWDHDAEHRWCEKDKGHDKNHERSREHEQDHTCQNGKGSHHESASGHDCSRVAKCGRSAEPGGSSGHLCSKQ